ncbi:SCP2 sterol-binding domain-containing protein [Candidatus Galacturonibacter soehngenii]|uniref:SCP2 sterol-binding domain-containing protein n=1 Tax=Candidatus Galacturonatibacter soehngenii TaxID=2307010 RepID=A0A7V7QL36_9FIRM|nr:SCP2 sterol-binding domain-containing protein [Candidatus Galacturonibacter soehngenii]KAB1438629.1 SCP2 sterol-binding domain-containing protein [Candidatus Galacturonibacter soehngenii]
MRINIYYGGRGLIDDPTLYVINKMQQVFDELRVETVKYNLFEQKNSIMTLPQTLKAADGIILATTVEWLGIGGYMQMFLDACWLYADKEKLSSVYMQPVVMSTTYGEREASLTLSNAWTLLGGLECNGICGYVDDLASFEVNEDYSVLIEKASENLYRAISQKLKNMPTSNMAVKQNVLRTKGIELTPQETEQLSKFASDDRYVKKQKADIEELASLFKAKLDLSDNTAGMEYINDFKSHFESKNEAISSYAFTISDKQKKLILELNKSEINCYYGNKENVDVEIKLTSQVMDSIIHGKMTFQRAFMSGEMTAKGDFKILRLLDDVFTF